MRTQVSNLKPQNCKKVRVSLAMVNTKAMEKLKGTWFGRRENTDVVAFPLQQEVPDGTYLLGEIVINIEQAAKQSKQYGVLLEEEIARLAAHGALHLLGYEDLDSEGRQEMEKIEEEVVNGVAKAKRRAPSKNPVDYFRFFVYAWEGLRHALRYHRSFGLQVLAGLGVIGLGLILQLGRTEWLVLLLIIFAVWVAELLNTAIETTLDYMAKEHHPQVKIAKDVAAGAVLLISIGAIVMGLIIFLPYFS